MQITPRKNHRFVETLCNRIVPGSLPISVPVLPAPNAQIDQCFLNVKKHILQTGGDIKHGWCIWELPGLFIEAEFHGIWINPTGQKIDITPKKNKETEILFLQDDSAIFDENSLRRRENVRLAIKDDPVIHAFIKSAKEYVKYLEDHTDPNNPRRVIIDTHVESKLRMKKHELEFAMISLPVGRNDMCRCGSADKFKKCCGR